MKLGISALIRAVEEKVALANRLDSFSELRDGRSGGYFAIRDEESGSVLVVVRVGNFSSKQDGRYFRNALEKGERVFNNGTLSSWTGRNPENMQFGGGIRINGFIISFSGYSEFIDEALMLAVALELEVLTATEVANIVSISKNNLVEMLAA